MQMTQYHYLPLAPGFFAILIGLFIIVLVLRSVRFAYESLGISSGAAMWLLFASLVGSIFNIPIAELPPERVMSDQVINFFGMQYEVPIVNDLAGTVIAVNVGGAVIPTLMSLYLLAKRELWIKGLIATVIVAAVLHLLADPVPGLGIGADLTNLEKVRGLGAPVASIGGAGTFDGIFLTGILAVLIACLFPQPRQPQWQ
jgi:uncharacterized membrane protein